jgi:hypothetical protein
MNIMPRTNNKNLLLGGLCLIITAIYVYPFIATWLTIGIVELPPLFSTDLYRYLNIVNLRFISPGLSVNPWFGTIVPISDVLIYDRFGMPLKLFHIISYIFNNNLTLINIKYYHFI